MSMDLTNAASLAAALIALRDESSRSVCAATNIKPANLSVWLRGKEQVISQKRVASLLCYLDVVGGRLARGKIHRWHVYESLDALKLVLETLLTKEQKSKSLLCSDGNDAFPHTRVLGLWSEDGWNWIHLSVRPGIQSAPILHSADIAFGHEYVLPLDFEILPLNDLELCEKIILSALPDRDLNNTSKNAPLSSIPNMIDLPQMDSNNPEFITLCNTLQQVLDSGVPLQKINQLLTNLLIRNSE